MAGKHALGEVGVHIADDATSELRRAAFLSSEDDLLKQLTRSFAQLDPVRPSFHRRRFLRLTNWSA
jgi:hypothetical protein